MDSDHDGLFWAGIFFASAMAVLSGWVALITPEDIHPDDVQTIYHSEERR